MAQLVLTVIGDDRPGMVSELSGVVSEAGGNWLESQMSRLSGTFAGIVLVDVPEEQLAGFTAAATALPGLEVRVVAAGAPTGALGSRLHLHLIGHDRPGIVHLISETLANTGASIDELYTTTLEAPMAGGLLFEADAIVRLPERLTEDDLRHSLEGIANELMVDLDLEDAE